MGKIRVNTDVLINQQTDMVRVSETLGTVSQSLSWIDKNLSWNIEARGQIKAKLNAYSTYTEKLQRKNETLSSALQTIAKEYQNTEKNLVGAGAVVSKNTGDAKGKDTKKESDKKSWWTWSDTWKLIEKAGILGTGMALFGNLITGGVSTKNVLGATKTLSSLIGQIAKSTTDPSFDWRRLIGWTTDIKAGEDNSFLTLLRKKGIDDLKFSNAKTVGDKIAVGAKWAGHALTIATTAYDNFTDPDNTTFGRKLAETIGESAIKIGEGVLLTAGITAAFAAAGVAAPAVVIGGVTVIATWGIDKISEKITGKNFAEAASDFVLDTGKNLIEGSKDLMKQTGAKIKGITDTIGGWWKKSTPLVSGAW